jgi:HNH endonuclease
MRFVKLSQQKEFDTLEEVRRFFLQELRDHEPPGKFRIPSGHIAKDELEPGEPLVFTYSPARVVFTAQAETGLEDNNDEWCERYPGYFVINLSTLREADEDLRELEGWYNAAARASDPNHRSVNFIGQGWNHLPDSSPHTQALWVRLRGWLRPEDGDLDDSNDGASYRPQDGDLRLLVARQVRLRQGQGQFRDALLRRYGDRCLVTGCSVLAVLEAAHIHPHRGTIDNHPENGLLLRGDVHTLFDLNLLGIEPEQLRVELDPAVVTEYGGLAGTRLRCVGGHRPSLEALRERYQEFLRRVPAPYRGQAS